MKNLKIYGILAVLLMVFPKMFGGTVEMQRAKALGARFVESNFLENRKLEWVYTAVTNSGRPAFHAFNGTSGGFVIVSASDLTSPILGYSETGVFNPENLPDGLRFFLDGYAQSVDFAEERMAKADFAIAQEWANLERCGMTQASKLGAVEPLIATRWDQECYYNEYCPEDEGGSCGHVKVGCVATAMGQIMKYWNHPEQGLGSHTNNSYFYGPLTVNFGETTYHWDEMPDQLTDYNDAVATLLYHCGISVDMAYAPAPNGSGASQASMKSALSSYFDYASSTYIERDSYPSYEEWTSIMRQALDSEIPIAYCGTDTQQGVGGHSFICDGYDANGLFHFNWGWSGELDGYFSIDNLQTYNLAWNAHQAMIYDIRPRLVYNETPQAPDNLAVEPQGENSYLCSISWKNPTKTLNNSNLSTIDQIIVKRDGQVVYAENNVAPGATMEITDEVPFFALYDYKVYAVYHGNHGKAATQDKVRFGPSCNWSIEANATSPGWNGAAFTLYNNAGQPMEHIAPTSLTQVFSVAVPLGRVSFGWSAGNSTAGNVDFTIKDADGQQVYHYSGSPSDLPDGLFLTLNNGCGNVGCGQPSELYAVPDGNDVILSWLAADDETDYNVYRDGVVVKTVRNGATSFYDEQVAQGGHCYFVTAFCEGGESNPTNEACATAGEGCEPASALWFEMTSNNKVKLTWESPQPNEGLSGYYLYRTKESEMNWKKIKTLNASATSVVDNSNLEDETFYLYKLVAYYQAIDCYSAPARSKYNEFEYFVRVYWSVDGLTETEADRVKVYPNPAKDILRVEGLEAVEIQVYNTLGQLVKEVRGTNEINVSILPEGIYLLRITDTHGKCHSVRIAMKE